MLRHLVGALTLAFAAVAHGQEQVPDPGSPQDRAAHARYAMLKCSRDYGLRFVKSTALPRDVAEAAVQACGEERKVALGEFQATAKMDTDLMFRYDERLAQDVHRTALRAVIEGRFIQK